MGSYDLGKSGRVVRSWQRQDQQWSVEVACGGAKHVLVHPVQLATGTTVTLKPAGAGKFKITG